MRPPAGEERRVETSSWFGGNGAGIAMVHKNLRTLLYYVVGVTAVCLMIEVTTEH